MSFDASLLGYFIHAGIVVKAVMLILIGASIFSWTYIMQQAFFLKDLRQSAHQFERAFWSSFYFSLCKIFGLLMRFS